MVNTRHRATLVLCTLAILVTSQPVAAQGYKWWTYEEAKKELRLTDPQTAELETIFQTLRPRLKELAEDFQLERKLLSEIMHAMKAEEWEVTLQLDKLESARSALNKTRILMLYRMHKVLSPEQLDGLHSLSERRRSTRDARQKHRQ